MNYLIFALFTFIAIEHVNIIASQEATTMSSGQSISKEALLKNIKTAYTSFNTKTIAVSLPNNITPEQSIPTFSKKEFAMDSTNRGHFLTDKIIPSAAIIASIGTAYYLTPTAPKATRGLLSVGDAFGAAGTAKTLGFIAALTAGSYWTSRLLNGLHYGCQRDKDLLEQKFEGQVAEMENRWKTSLQKSLEHHQSIIQNNHNSMINQVNQALTAQRQETESLISPILEAVEFAVIKHDDNDPELNTKNKEGAAQAAIDKAKKELLTFQNNPIAPMVQPIESIPTVTFQIPERPKEKTNCCCCTLQ